MGEADASPTPTPGRRLSRDQMSGDDEQIMAWAVPSSTALEDNRPAMELENACRESCCQTTIGLVILVAARFKGDRFTYIWYL